MYTAVKYPVPYWVKPSFVIFDIQSSGHSDTQQKQRSALMLYICAHMATVSVVDVLCQQPIERKPRVFAPLVIPKDLQRALPFKDKPKVPRSSKDPVQSNRIAVVREPKERQVYQMTAAGFGC